MTNFISYVKALDFGVWDVLEVIKVTENLIRPSAR